MIPMMYGGYKFIISPKLKTYFRYVAQSKSKVGKRNVRVRKFTGLVDLVSDGDLIVDDRNMRITCNEQTFDKIKHELQGM